MSKKEEEDVGLLIAFAKELDIELDRESVLHPRPESVISFYESVLKWINTSLSKLGLEKYDHEDMKAKQLGAEFCSEIQICAQVHDLLEQIGIDYFSINDVLSKLPLTRTKVYFKYLLTFLMYMQTEVINGNECSETLEIYMNHENQLRSLEEQHEKHIEDINMDSETLALDDLKLNGLQEDIKMMEKKYSEALAFKKEREEIDTKARAEFDKCSDVLVHKSEYLKMLSVQEQDLLKTVVSSNKHQALIDIEENFKQKIAGLEKEISCLGKHEEILKTCKYYTDIIESIKALNYETMVAADVFELNKQIKKVNERCNVLNSAIKTQESNIVNTKGVIHSIEEEKETHLIQHKAMKGGLLKDMETHKQLNIEAVKQLEKLMIDIGKVERAVIQLEEEHCTLESEEVTLQEVHNNNYRALLNAESRIVVLFHNSLSKIARDTMRNVSPC